MAQSRRSRRCRTIPILTGARLSITPMASRAAWRSSSLISPLAQPVRKSSPKSDSFPLNNMKHLIATSLVLAVGTLVGLADSLVIKGSDTLGAKLVPQLAEEFKAQHPGTTFDIAAEGSATGIAAIIDGTAQIGMASRPAKPEEIATAATKNVKLTPTTVAYDGIAVIVSSANPIKS